ncbi:YrrS family protein [Pueribacillus sp. YX66]|uniref:YrrS family protein n=1 Tax=Pueribacillus sp. YX66 TaxID=3229242 RepID=UPI00358D76AC
MAYSHHEDEPFYAFKELFKQINNGDDRQCLPIPHFLHCLEIQIDAKMNDKWWKQKGWLAMQTRYEERQKKRRQNLILNGLIAIVFIFIVIVGAQLLSSPSSQMEASQSPEENEQPLTKQTGEEESMNKSETGERDEDIASPDEEHMREEDGYRFVGGGPDGPWEPIGTKQTGEHVTQYTRDSLDWQEMEMALAYGAGIDHDDLTVIWLGNGGDPQRAKGQVKSDNEPNTIYHVTIEWIDGEGWKPIEVQTEQ